MKVTVLIGGRSLERAVSLRSGARVEDAGRTLGHEVVTIDADESLVSRLKSEQPDVAFIALPGPEARTERSVAARAAADPLAAPTLAASVLCMDKVQAEHRMRQAGIPDPGRGHPRRHGLGELGAADAFA